MFWLKEKRTLCCVGIIYFNAVHCWRLMSCSNCDRARVSSANRVCVLALSACLQYGAVFLPNVLAQVYGRAM